MITRDLEKSNLSCALLVVFTIASMIGSTILVLAYTTSDGLVIGADTEGRIAQGSLTIGGQTIMFCSGLDGGFYLRDNTPSTSGLPAGVINELLYGGFTLNPPLVECDDILDEPPTDAPWKYSVQQGSSSYSDCATFEGSDVAMIEIQEDPVSWGLIYQDVHLQSNPPSEIELYTLVFEVATECGYRSSNHPWDHEEWHGSHRVHAFIEWFNGTPTGPANAGLNPNAIAVSTLHVFNATRGLTPFSLNAYRPLLPVPATDARIKLLVEGYMPNDGRDSGQKNFVYFDNVAFYKAPDIIQLEGAWNAGEVALLDTQTSSGVGLSMDLTVTVEGPYILFNGWLINEQVAARAIDFGFSLPILDYYNQEVEWCNDVRDSVRIRADELEQTIPYRMVGPADIRLRNTAFLQSPQGSSKNFSEKTYRDKGLNISAYPLSTISITKNGNQGGLAFGDNLNASHAPISHFGYRVENPGPSDLNFKGRYYVEFNIGVLGSGSYPDNIVPFSFILFRGDLPGWQEKSVFRDAVEKYETQIFPEFFSLPGLCDDSWEFGGGKYPSGSGANGFDVWPNDFGYRYTTIPNHDDEDEDQHYRGLIADLENPSNPSRNDVDVLIYRHPWAGAFENWPDSPGTPDQGTMNTHDTQETTVGTFDPTDEGLGGGWDYGTVWYQLYTEQKKNNINLPGYSLPQMLFARNVDWARDPSTQALEDSNYFFPVLLSDAPVGEGNVASKEIAFINDAYQSIGLPSQSVRGLAGLMFDNVFYGEDKGLHVDILDESSPQSLARQEAFVAAGGTLTYSMSHFKPAIPQLPLHVKFLDRVRDRLEIIDDSSAAHYGGGAELVLPLYTESTQDEIISGNFNSTYIGGSKYGIMRSDVGGFESNPALSFNNGTVAFNFRRTVARDKNMARVFKQFPCLSGILPNFTGCTTWKDYWADSFETMYKQIVNESIWLTLAWGFHPSIHQLLMDDGAINPNWTLEDFVDGWIRDRFVGDVGFEGYTSIYRQLHLAGWKPLTKAEADVDEAGGEKPLLYVERFGPDYIGAEGNAGYFTVLNNDTLSYTLSQLTEEEIGGTLAPEFYFKDFQNDQDLRNTTKCEDVETCSNYPSEIDAEAHFDEKKKHFYLEIHDPISLNLWAANLHAEQLVENPGYPGVLNWPAIEAGAFDETYVSGATYSIKRKTSLPVSVIIGGERDFGVQDPILIKDKVLMVFKIWSSLIVNNGPEGGGEGGESRDGSQSDDALVSQYYERYGYNWQREADERGFGGNFDLLPNDDMNGSVFYRFTIGRPGPYRVGAHVPALSEAPAPAVYEAYVLDYFEDPVGATPLGDPVWTNTVDLTGSESYASVVDEEGFIEVGSLDISLVEPELVTVVIKLRSAGEDGEHRSASSGYVVADAVKLDPEETQE